MKLCQTCPYIIRLRTSAVNFLHQTPFPLKNAVFWDVMPCSSRRTDVSDERVASITVKSIRELGTLAVTSKRRFSHEPHGVTSQKMAFFIVTAVKNSKSYIALTG
jgi:hypothetical protein